MKARGWSNILDIMGDWINYMGWDEMNRESYDAIPATYNNPSSTGSLSVAGIEDYTAMADLDLEFNVGGPIQSQADDADLADYRNFQVDAAYTGGTPAAGNTMTLNYEYWNGAAWVPQNVVVSGTGHDNQVTLAGGVDIYVAKNGYSASDGPYELTPGVSGKHRAVGGQPAYHDLHLHRSFHRHQDDGHRHLHRHGRRQYRDFRPAGFFPYAYAFRGRDIRRFRFFRGHLRAIRPRPDKEPGNDRGA